MTDAMLRDYLRKLDLRLPEMSEDQRTVMALRLERCSFLVLEMAARVRCNGAQPGLPDVVEYYRWMASNIEDGIFKHPAFVDAHSE
jgi:hypothetical protein